MLKITVEVKDGKVVRAWSAVEAKVCVINRDVPGWEVHGWVSHARCQRTNQMPLEIISLAGWTVGGEKP